MSVPAAARRAPGQGTWRRRATAAWIAAVLVALPRAPAAIAATAADYRPPGGFNGHAWETPLAAVHSLSLWRADEALGFGGKVTEFHCVADNLTGEACSTTYSRIEQQMQGEGSHALAEYYFRLDNNPWHADGIDVEVITYLFCAHAVGKYLPRPVKDSLKLCGARVMFRSAAPAVQAGTAEAAPTNYERILGRLVADYGEPPGYARRARLIVSSLEEEADAPQKTRPPRERYSWCGVNDGDAQVLPACTASVTLAFDAATGEGTVLLATPPVYAFAYARHMTGDENNDLYVLLEAPTLAHKFRKERSPCTGSHICQPEKSAMSARQLRDFGP